MRENQEISDIYRRSSLIAGRTSKMALPYIGSPLCAAAVTAIDSLIAGISIGADALAAIAASGPLLAVAQILHCLLGFGIDKLMIQAIGKGNRKEADRIFGAIIIAAFAVYLAVFLPLLLFEKQLLRLYVHDPDLIDTVILYSRPILAAAPVFEVFLCIERAFRIDGRAKLLAMRSVNTNAGNILFDFLLVGVLKFGVNGLAWASVISSLLGYCASLSHFFSKKRTVRPDFSVIFSFREMLSYIKNDIRIGSSATLDELLEVAALTVQTGAISAVGGADGLAVWAIYKTLRGIVMSLSNGVSASVSVHAGLSYSQKDYDGVRFSALAGTKHALGIGLIVDVIILSFAGPIASAFHIDSGLRLLCAQCLRIGCIAFPSIAFLTIITSYLPTVNRIGLTNLLVIIQKLLPIIAGIIGYHMGLRGVFTGYVIACSAAALILLSLLKRDGFWFVPERDPETIFDYSILLKPDRIAAMKADVDDKLLGCAYPATFCSKASLVTEDSMNYISQQNPDTEVCADIRMKRYEDGVQITVIDDGVAYNPLSDLAEADPDRPGALEAMIILGLTANVNYDRVLDLNHLSLYLNLPADAEPDV